MNRLDVLIQNQTLFTFAVDYEDVEHTGIALRRSEELVLFRMYHDFRDTGFSVMRIEALMDVDKDPRSEAFFDTVFNREGLKAYRTHIDVAKLNLTDWPSFFESIIECETLVQITTPYQNDIDPHFFVGKFISCSDDTLYMRELDAAGQWHATLTKIDFADVMDVEFDTHYGNMFLKHADPLD